MRLEDLLTYITDENHSELTKGTVEFELGEDGTFYITKTKETFTFYDEADADHKITVCRTEPVFAGCDKTFKAGKVNKNGEVTREDEWKVVIKTKQE